MDIVCLGELLVDMFPAELGQSLADVSAFLPKPGGAPANVAVAAARLGAQSAFIGKVGEDAFGRHLARVLQREGVETQGMRFDVEARTTLAFIAQPDENTSEFVFYRNPGADMMLRPDELDRTLIREARVFHFGSISLIHEPSRSATLGALQTARQGGALISFDVNYRPSLWPDPGQARSRILEVIPLVDLIKVNEAELALLARNASGVQVQEDMLQPLSRELLSLGPALCVVTLGAEGSFFQSSAGGAHVAPFRVQTVDATGCGDAFVAGLLWQLMQVGWRADLEPTLLSQALRYANAVGALTALKKGVIPALPTAAEVETFLRQQNSGL